MHIFLRAETYQEESRAALTPMDVAFLRKEGFKVTVESSQKRVFTDSDYGQVTNDKWYDQDSDTIIIGLKELDNLDKLKGHKHVYFSHCYKGQTGADAILDAFAKTQSSLYDLEYFMNPAGKRILAFGYYAGIVGAVLGIRQHYNTSNGFPDIAGLEPWSSYDAMIDEMIDESCRHSTSRICVVGKGRCSMGVQHILNRIGLRFDLIGNQQEVIADNYDILFNCILLDQSYNKTWVSKDHSRPLLIIDVSCDYMRPNNPLLVYSEGSSWQTPVLHATEMVSVIAIDNLPALLPCESSTEFSGLLARLLLRFGDSYWSDNLARFRALSRPKASPHKTARG